MKTLFLIYFIGVTNFSLAGDGSLDSLFKSKVTAADLLRISLPKCDGDNINSWNNCIGVANFGDGQYDGQWNFGLRDGWGIFQWSNGDFYSGQWSNGYKHGFGKIIWSNGTEYTGNWSRNSIQGYGEKTSKNGYYFIGEWVNNQPTVPQSSPSTSSTLNNNNINAAKSKCAALGFKAGTETFGNCVLKLSK